MLRAACAALILSLAACADSAPAEPSEPPPVDASPSGVSADAATAANEAVVEGAGPALWRASDEDTTLYLFGTIHLLPPDLEWRTEAFDRAFDEAETLYLETPVDADESQLGALVVQYGMFPPDEGLLDLLDDADEEALAAAAREVAMPMAALDRMRPWFAGISLSTAYIIAEDYDPQAGVEQVLAPSARSDGKEMRYFETSEEQIRFFADLATDVQIGFLMEGVRQIDEAGDMLARMDQAWIAGDVDALAALMLEDQSTSAPLVYDALIKRRNEAWAETLDEVAAAEPGVFMIAVGAGHIAGDDSLAKLLADRGLTVERLQ